MADFLDIAPVTSMVRIGDGDVAVPGLSIEGVATVCLRFPELVDVLKAGAIDIKHILDLGPKVVAAIIAAGCGHPGNDKAEAKAMKLPLRYQAELLAAIKTATIGDDAQSFIRALSQIGDGLFSEAGSKAPSKPSLKVSNS